LCLFSSPLDWIFVHPILELKPAVPALTHKPCCHTSIFVQPVADGSAPDIVYDLPKRTAGASGLGVVGPLLLRCNWSNNITAVAPLSTPFRLPLRVPFRLPLARSSTGTAHKSHTASNVQPNASYSRPSSPPEAAGASAIEPILARGRDTRVLVAIESENHRQRVSVYHPSPSHRRLLS
jgi:hypothetical protein